MPARKKKHSVRLRSTKPRKRWWSLFLFLALVLIALWVTLSLSINAILRWVPKGFQNQVIAITDSPKAGQSGSILIAQLDPEKTYSKLIIVPSSSMAGELRKPWEVAAATGVLVNQIILLENTNFADTHSIKRTIQTNLTNLLKLGKFNEAWQLLPIWQLLQNEGVQIVENPGHAASELVILGRLGETCPIGIANTTSISGVAGKYADLVAKQGGLVVRVTNREVTTDETIIFIDDQLTTECNLVASLLQASLPGEVKVEVISELFSSDRVGVLVQLGSSSAEQLQKISL